MSERERALWQAIRRGLMLIVNAIDQLHRQERTGGAEAVNY